MDKRGPKTTSGKAKVRFNALKHGILSSSPVIPGFENPEDWQRHHDGILARYAPDDELEASLVERIALLLWRLARVARFETDAIARNIEQAEYSWPDEEQRRNPESSPFAWAVIAPEDYLPKDDWIQSRRRDQLIPDAATLERITRYEAHLHRQLIQTMHELEVLQTRRKGQATPLARLDIQVHET